MTFCGAYCPASSTVFFLFLFCARNHHTGTTCNYAQGALYGGLQRRAVVFRPSCSTLGDTVHMCVTASSGVADVAALNALIAATNRKGQAVLGAVGTSTFQTLQQIFQDAVVITYQTDMLAIAALKAEGSTLLGVAASRLASDYDPSVVWFSVGHVENLVSFFRREPRTENKVANSSAEPYWRTGNTLLAQVYNAAQVWLASLGTKSDIYAAYNMTVVDVGDCLGKESAYSVPETPIGTLQHVLSSGKLTIGVVIGESYPLKVILPGSADPTGALTDLERSVATWIYRQYSSVKPVIATYIKYNSSAELLAALDAGEVDVTSNNAFVGGQYDGEARRNKFQASCSSVSTQLSLYVQKSLSVTTLPGFVEYLMAHSAENVTVGALGTGNVQIAQSLLGVNVSVVLCENSTELFQSLLRVPRRVGIVPDYVPTVPPEFGELVEIPLGVTISTCAFFRRDAYDACGDGELDPSCGEECDIKGNGCTATCHCDTYFKPNGTRACVAACGDGVVDTNFGEECDSSHGCNDKCVCKDGYHSTGRHCSKSSMVGAIVGGTLGGIFVIVMIFVIVGLLVTIPLLRRKFVSLYLFFLFIIYSFDSNTIPTINATQMIEGGKEARSHMFAFKRSHARGPRDPTISRSSLYE
eukprot:TRINITY_DN2204_c0_g1_i4.p1 TRINITY_DN2204_c0_g1~~TRINITY_DN2204_c0_g1_i4.p1  ORF type:complete len:641 (-),score=114.99 TRINITY_DN2204_c0_g1_i4:32-1954(-)